MEKPMVTCEVCNKQMRNTSLYAHNKTQKHLRNIGELPPKPQKPPPKAVGRPRIYDEPFLVRNPNYMKQRTWYCSLCDVTIPQCASTVHRGTQKHIEKLMESLKIQ